MSDTDFDFDFDVNRGRSEQGTPRPEEPEQPRARPRRDREPPKREPSSNGGNGKRSNGSGVREALEEARHRVGGNGSEANGATEAPRREKPPLRYRDDEPIDEPDEFPPRRRRFRPERGPDPDKGAALGEDEDWLDLAENDAGGDGFGSLTDDDDPGPAGPRTPGEGRALAREARQRATERGGRRSSALLRDDLDFKEVLEQQPQKSGIARRRTSLLYGFREIGEGARERAGHARELLRAGGARLREGGARLREAASDSARSASACPRVSSSRRLEERANPRPRACRAGSARGAPDARSPARSRRSAFW